MADSNDPREAAAAKLAKEYDRTDDHERRMLIIDALGKTGATKAVEELSNIVDNTNSRERKEAALKALGEIGQAGKK